MKLSAVVITKNEAHNIGRCLDSLKFADEIIVVDDFSSDATPAIARQKGARLVQNKWKGYGNQKNVGLSHAQHDWVFFLDADEEAPPELTQEIRNALQNPKFSVYWVKVLDIFLGKALHHLKGNNPRLINKQSAVWSERLVHEQVMFKNSETKKAVTLNDGYSGNLSSHIIHYGHKTIRSYLKKMHRYTSLDSRQMKITGTHRSGKSFTQNGLLPITLSVRQFVKLYIYRGGARDGLAGFIWSLLSAYYEWEMARKYLKL